MTFLPIVERELRVRSRQKVTHRFRVGSALIAILLVMFMLFSGSAFSSPQTMGQPMFNTLAWLSFAYCLFEGARNTADCLSEEKRAGTLGLLFLTDLKGYDVVLGKFIATSLNSFYGLLAIVPALAIPILIGGVTGGEFWRLVLVLINTLFFSLTTGIFVSSISRNEREAWAGTVAIILVLTAVPVAFLWSPIRSFTWIASISPGVGFFSLFDAAYSANPDRYDQSLLIIHLLSWLFLISAIVLLPRSWQEDGRSTSRSAVERWADAILGGRSTRVREGRRFLNLNPALWLASRQQRSMGFLWLLIALAGVAGVASWLVRPAWPAYLMAGIVLHFVICVFVADQACNFFPDARSSGALELLLCTPLPVGEIVDGYRGALERSFARPVLALLCLEVVIAIGLVITAKHIQVGLIPMIPIIGAVFGLMLLTDLYATGEYGMWLGLVSKKSTHALTKTVLYVLVLPVFCCFTWPVLPLVKNLIFINYSRDQLRRRFRAVATERFAGPEKESEWLASIAPRPNTDLPPVLPR